MDRVHASAEKENKRIIKDVLRDYVSKGYLSKEEAKEFMGEYGDEIIENPESTSFGYKAEEAQREEQEKDDKESAEILGKTCKELIQIFHTTAHLKLTCYHCYFLTGVEQDADERTITVAYRKLALKYRK